ncbi:MAG: MATE family efflux transporter [Pseudoflavonifractor sp.]
MNNKLDRDYGFGSLLRFALPSIVMMMFMSTYTMVDGFFVARFVGSDALSATNIVYPAISVVLAVGIMLATGGSAVVARKLGEGDEAGARRSFSLLTLVGIGAGLVFLLLGITLVTPICHMLGASGPLLPDCVAYLRILLVFAPAYVLQLLFQSFFVVAGRPGLGLWLTIGAGLTNMVLDYLFIVPLNLGLAGAAWATVIGYLVPAVAGLIFFGFHRSGLHFSRPTWDPRMLVQSCLNGSSEMVTNLSSAVVTFLFNIFMLRFLGTDGVAAITIVLYAQFLLTALYLGFSMGVAPIISFHYGAGNQARLHKIFRSCLIFIAFSSVAVFAFSMAFADGVVTVFAPVGSPVHVIAAAGFRKFSPAFLFAGLSIFASAHFTALSDGRTSAIISFLRTFGFILVGLLLLPIPFEADGVWFAVPCAELLSALVSILYLRGKRKKYGYA